MQLGIVFFILAILNMMNAAYEFVRLSSNLRQNKGFVESSRLSKVFNFVNALTIASATLIVVIKGTYF